MNLTDDDARIRALIYAPLTNRAAFDADRIDAAVMYIWQHDRAHHGAPDPARHALMASHGLCETDRALLIAGVTA